MALVVTQREREIARRMALGARRGDVIGGTIGHCLRLAVPGLALGSVGVLLSGRLPRSFLYEVGPGDLLTPLLVSAAVARLVAATALLPARREARTDPVAVLRGE